MTRHSSRSGNSVKIVLQTTEAYLTAVKRILRYLKGTVNLAISTGDQKAIQCLFPDNSASHPSFLSQSVMQDLP